MYTLSTIHYNDATSVKEPLVSVYVPTYNQERYIAQCLEGILAQQCDFGIEVVVIDDASSDATPQIIEEYAERYPNVIKPVLLKENLFSQGRTHLKEVFLPMARGEYMAFCDGDDYWTEPTKLQHQVDFLRSHPAYSMCFHNFRVVSELPDGLTPPYDWLRHSRRCGVTDVLLLQLAQTSTMVGRIALLKNDHEYMTERVANGYHLFDVRIYLAYLNAGKVYGFGCQWSSYRLQGEGMGTSLLASKQAEHRHLQLFEYLSGCYGGLFRRLAPACHRLLRQRSQRNAWTAARRNSKPLKATSHLLRAFAIDPKLFIYQYFRRYVY